MRKKTENSSKELLPPLGLRHMGVTHVWAQESGPSDGSEYLGGGKEAWEQVTELRSVQYRAEQEEKGGGGGRADLQANSAMTSMEADNSIYPLQLVHG